MVFTLSQCFKLLLEKIVVLLWSSPIVQVSFIQNEEISHANKKSNDSLLSTKFACGKKECHVMIKIQSSWKSQLHSWDTLLMRLSDKLLAFISPPLPSLQHPFTLVMSITHTIRIAEVLGCNAMVTLLDSTSFISEIQ